MTIYVFPADVTGCGYYRLIWPARALQKAGHDVKLILPEERGKMMQATMRDGKIVDVNIPPGADVIVLQRVTNRYLAQSIPIIRAKGVAVVVDTDDDLTCVHPANPAFNNLHPRNGNRDHSWENTLRSCDAATLVTVSTPELAERYGKRTPARVLYNMIPERLLKIQHRDSDIVGWAGSLHSHPTDLQELGPSIAQHLQAGGKFRIIGPVSGIQQALGVPPATVIEHTGIMQLETYPLGVATLGIGLAPLADSRFNKSKSWLKMMEYAAVGVPCIGSPRAEYTRIHKLGVGLLAKNANAWRQQIRKLLREPNLRQDLSDRGREVVKSHTIEGNAWRWLEIWQEAVKLETRRPLAASTT